MATGDKRPVVMEADRAAANGIATLGEDKLLLPDQRPKADGLYMPDGRTIKEAFDGMVHAVSQLVNPNLLDNWYFANCVDQRGGYVVPPGTDYYLSDGTLVGHTDKYYTAKIVSDDLAQITVGGTIYTVSRSLTVRGYTGAGYGIDRWDLFGGTNPTMLIENGHIRLTGSGYFRQIIPVFQIPRGTVVTMSILMASGELYALTTTVPDYQADSPQVFFPGGFLRIFGWTADTDVYFIWFDGEVSPVATKMELGTQQTLAHLENGVWVLNEILDYGEQLARCQMYRTERKKATGYVSYSSGGVVVISPMAGCSFPATMRSNPSCAIFAADVAKTANKVSYYSSFEVLADGTVASVSADDNGIYSIGLQNSSIPVGTIVEFCYVATAEL